MSETPAKSENLCESELRGLAEAPAVAHWPIGQLRANARNARTHSDKQIAKLAAAIREFGFIVPIIVDSTGLILAGHGRFAAAMQLGLSTVPVIRISHLTDAQKRLFVVADNRLAELAGWDAQLLSIELKELSEIAIDLDVELTGFDTVDIDRLQVGPAAVTADPADQIPEIDFSSRPVSVRGDLWRLGRHTVLCGDALNANDYVTLLGSERAQMVFTDPPYNVPIAGHAGGKGRIKHPEFVMASGEMSRSQFTEFLQTTFANLAQFSHDGSIHFVAMDWRHISEITTAGEGVYGGPKNLIVWVKDNAGMGSFYRSQHELVFAFKLGSSPHINNFGLGERGRYRTNVWFYPGVNSFVRGRALELEMHPTVKPTALVVDAIRDCSKRGQIILDAFGGSGTTIIAAERTGRTARVLELDPHYVDTIVRRWESFTGHAARLSATDTAFAEVAAERTGSSAADSPIAAHVEEPQNRGAQSMPGLHQRVVATSGQHLGTRRRRAIKSEPTLIPPSKDQRRRRRG